MNDKAITRVHWSFWLISAIALIWNVLGSVNFFMQMNPDMLDAYRESERAIIQGRPVWATGAFAVAVIVGALGGLLLLLRKSAATYMFAASLAGVIVTMIHTLGVDYDFTPVELLVVLVMPAVVAAFLIWYSKHAEGRGWIS
ncbi:MAG: hypothetical protein GQ577_12600 [Woeseiaceae bacterium]|nr:hypothetical protein [Woeseiaceae bacterium]